MDTETTSDMVWVEIESTSDARETLSEMGATQQQINKLFRLVEERGREYVEKYQDSCPEEIDADVVVNELKIGIGEHLAQLVVNDVKEDVTEDIEQIIGELEESQRMAFSNLAVIVGSKSLDTTAMTWLSNEIMREKYEQSLE